MKFTEYNAEVPAASAYNDVLNEVFFGLPVMGQFLRHYAIRPVPTRHSVLHVLLSAYKEWATGRAAPAKPQMAQISQIGRPICEICGFFSERNRA